jgi:hypothetical protein
VKRVNLALSDLETAARFGERFPKQGPIAARRASESAAASMTKALSALIVERLPLAESAVPCVGYVEIDADRSHEMDVPKANLEIEPRCRDITGKDKVRSFCAASHGCS